MVINVTFLINSIIDIKVFNLTFLFQGGEGVAGSAGPAGAPGMRVRKELFRQRQLWPL